MDRDCAVCGVTIATDGCRHIGDIDGDRIIMSNDEWRRLTDELTRLRTLEGSLEGG